MLTLCSCFLRSAERLLPITTALAVWMWASFALALDVSGIRFGVHPDSERAVIELSESADFQAFVMNNPDRIVVDLKSFNWKAKSALPPAGGSVTSVRFGEIGAGKGRLVLETSRPVMIKSAFIIPKGSGQPDRLVIDYTSMGASAVNPSPSQKSFASIFSSKPAKKPVIEEQPPPAVPVPSVTATAIDPVPLPPKKTWEDTNNNLPVPTPSSTSSGLFSRSAPKPLIIIDPGHGGQDPGALGANGMYEKTIVLAVGLELKKQLEQSGKYRVKMTRDSDVFIPLRGRVNYARQNKGDLFISLHADSIQNSRVTGASVYTISEKASDSETEKLAERENKSDLIAGIDLSHQEDDVAGILIDLTARDTMNQSRYLAKTVLRNFDQHGIKTLDGSERSAGFAVLKAMDIPSILVEMGYLTNRDEVERLSSSIYRQKIATALKYSIDGYFQKKGR